MSFDQALALTVSPAVEGSFSVTRGDPGNWTGGVVGRGELLGTKCGISAEYLWGLPESDVFHQRRPQDLAMTDIATIYRDAFWNAVSCDQLHPTVAGLLFDAAVNQGQGCAAKCLQEALGVAADGSIGPKTLASAKAADPAVLHAELGVVRDAAYRADTGFATFGRGWIRRLMTVVAATAAFT